MTSQTLTAQPSSSVSASQASSHLSNLSTMTDTRMIESVRSLYQTSHQEEFLHLQAQVELLLEQLQALKQDRHAATQPSDSAHTMAN